MSASRLFTSRISRIVIGLASHEAKSNCTRNVLTQGYCRAMSSSLSSSKLDLDFHNDGIAVVTMKSGENRLHPETMDEWHQLLDEIEKNKDCKAVVTTGQDKFYSNGLDLEYVKTFTHHERQLVEYMDKLNRFIIRLTLFPVPTVAAVNGHAFAGGAFMAVAHDYRIMREDKGWICFNEILINVRFPPVLLALLRAKITSAQARTSAILYAKRFTASEALNSGLVDKVASQSQLVDIAKQQVLEVLGKDGIKRENLNCFKEDLYRSVLEAHQIHF